ncbi:MAG: prefoldin subunit alpha [Nanoarchaeota archaeon]|nr:prefoldin subunit alpha [Nanoarchaeota archaeon]MBU1051711.1 prefoldin subunit alpha [Nanoarchaeota archaeon]MBU1988288.1 prefoldin subunit alpha [Nanoarchaeota archaeon]
MENLQENQELLQRAIMLRQQSEEIEKQLDFVNEQIKELEQFSGSLGVLEKEKEEEVLTNIGRGVHMKVERKENEKLFVEVGAGVLVRKTPEEARKVIKEQVKKFQEAKLQLTAQLHIHAEQFREMMKEVEKIKRD